jgi:pimeloyl-ACP methyl ester carboxylesterase
MLRMTDADLRRVGRARFDNLEILWDYDGKAALEKLRMPLLWVLAGEDREAPVDTTRRALLQVKSVRPIDIYLFPHTDHGMVEFTTNPDGTRTATRITDGYLRLLADWIKGDVHGEYGRAERLR